MFRLLTKVAVVTLQNAKRVNPEVSNAELSRDFDGILESVW
jgi:hypothetical protein